MKRLDTPQLLSARLRERAKYITETNRYAGGTAALMIEAAEALERHLLSALSEKKERVGTYIKNSERAPVLLTVDGEPTLLAPGSELHISHEFVPSATPAIDAKKIVLDLARTCGVADHLGDVADAVHSALQAAGINDMDYTSCSQMYQQLRAKGHYGNE